MQKNLPGLHHVCHWLLETAGTAPKLCCLLRDFNQTRLCYLGFLSQQQKLPSGSVLFNQFYWTISSVCSGRKPGQFCKVYRHSKISVAAFDPNLLSQFLSLLCGVKRLYQVSGSSVSRVITNHLSDSVETKHPS